MTDLNSQTLRPARRLIGWSLLSLLTAYLTWLPIHLATEAHCHDTTTHDHSAAHEHDHGPNHGHAHGHHHDHGENQDHENDSEHSHHMADGHTLVVLKSEAFDADLTQATLTDTEVTPEQAVASLLHAADSRPDPGGGPPQASRSRAPPRA